MFSSAPEHLESVAALFVSIAQLAIASGALIGGVAVDHFGVTNAIWLGAGASLATSLLIFLLGIERRNDNLSLSRPGAATAKGR